MKDVYDISGVRLCEQKIDERMVPIREIRVNDVGKKVLNREVRINPDGSKSIMRGIIVDLDLSDPEAVIVWVKFDGFGFPMPLYKEVLAWHEEYYRINNCVGLF